MGWIVTQNVTQHAVKASNYRLLCISAGKARRRSASVSARSNKRDGVAGARTWILDRLDAEQPLYALAAGINRGKR